MGKRQIFLFAGGPKIYSGNSKPFCDFYTGTPLLVHSYNHLSNYFDIISVYCNSSEIERVYTLKDEFCLDKMVVLSSPDESTTFEKFYDLAMSFSDCNFDICVSYPDIFSSKNFWETENSGDITMVSSPVKSRFPKVLLKPFSDQVRGVTDHESRVPSNPTFVFSGLIIFNPSRINNLIRRFEADGAELKLETDFLDFMALNKFLRNKTCYDTRVHVDSFRDLNLALKTSYD